jgi:hypothetical protein
MSLLIILPHEIILHIARYLSSKDCLSLSRTSSVFLFLLREFDLWQEYAMKDSSYPKIFFDNERKRGLSGCQIYRQVIECKELVSSNMVLEFTLHRTFCRKQTIPGTPYCLSHCIKNGINVCWRCELKLANHTGYCQDCHHYRMRNGCRYFKECCKDYCGKETRPNEKICDSCQKLLSHEYYH